MQLAKSDQTLDPDRIPYGGKTLHKISAAYRAYIKLPAPPIAAPIFESDENNHPIVEMGEVFCLWKHHGRRHCGHKALGRNFLQRHLASAHGRQAENRHGEAPMDIESIERARGHYVHCMINMDYEGKEAEEAEFSNYLPTITLSELHTKHRRRIPGASPVNSHSTSSESMESDQHQKMISRARQRSTPNSLVDNVIALESEDEDVPRHVKTENIDSINNNGGALRTHDQRSHGPARSSRLQNSRSTTSEVDHSRAMAPVLISLDSDSESEALPVKSEESGSAAVKRALKEAKVDSDVEDLELEVEEAEAQLRLIAAKRKLMARKKRRQERG